MKTTGIIDCQKRKVRIFGRIVLGMLIGASIAVPTTSAQDAGNAEPQAQSSGSLEMITVTARKRVEPLQSTPVAATVIGGQKLELTFHNDLKTLAFPAPNVNIATVGIFSNAVSLSIRGISTADIDSTIDPPVAIFVDGVYIPRPVATSLDLFDVEQIEILRGPQGTLFGRNTTAGAVQVRTRRPSGEFGLRGRATIGKFGRTDLRVAADIPIAKDKVHAKIAAMSQNMDGYYTSSLTGEDLGEEDVLSIRPMLQIFPTERFDITIIGEYHRNKSATRPSQNQSRPNQLLCVFHGFCGFELGEGDEFLVARGQDTFIDAEAWGVTVEMNLDIGPGTITSVSNYREMDEVVDYDVDQTEADMFFTTRDQPHEQWSTELRFASTAWERFDFVAGIYYFKQEYFLERNTFLDVLNTGNITHLVSNTGQDHDSFSLFAEGNYHVSDKLTFILGGRYTYEKKTFFQEPFGPGAAQPRIDAEPASWNNFGPKAGVEYQWTPDLMTYFTYSRGFKSGGFNGRCGQAQTCLRPFDPEIVDGFELGLKSEFFDRRVRVNLALFWNEYDDLQRTVIVPLPGAANPQETVTDNAASARIRGLELELTALPFEGFTLDLGLGYLDADYSDFCADINGASFFEMAPTSPCGGEVVQTDNLGNPGGPANYLVDQDFSNFELARAPEWNISINATYEVPVGNAGSIILNGRYTYTSKLFTDATEQSLRKSTNMVDASISFGEAEGRYRISVFGRNLTNEIYADSRTLVAALFNTRAVNPPRRWGIELAWDL